MGVLELCGLVCICAGDDPGTGIRTGTDMPIPLPATVVSKRAGVTRRKSPEELVVVRSMIGGTPLGVSARS